MRIPAAVALRSGGMPSPGVTAAGDCPGARDWVGATEAALAFVDAGDAAAPWLAAALGPAAALCPAATTTIWPVISTGWTMQKYAYVPGVSNVCLNVWPLSLSVMPESNALPVSELGVPDVTECGSPMDCVTVQVTLSPCVTVIVGGSNFLPAMLTG